MNKIARLINLALTLCVTCTALASVPVNYYNNALGKSNDALMGALRGIIRDHTQLSYSALWNAFKTTDTDEQGYIIDMYSNCRYKPDEHGASSSAVGGGFNREHSFPKSWFNDDYPMYTDLFHLYPTDIKVNSQRSNYPFGVCAGGTRLTNGSLYGKARLGTSTYPGYSGTVFEPDDEYKGDFARTYFYMVTCYMNELPSWSGSPQLNYSANKYKAFSTWTINMLMEWTRLDPVSEKEIKRNDAVYSIQGNRNPFIDHPELAEYIWGDRQGQVWNGSSEPITAAITAPADGSTINMGSTIAHTLLEYTIDLKGQGLTQNLEMAMSENEYFSVSQSTFTASEVNGGTSFTLIFSADDEGTFSNTITIGSDEASTTFTVVATALPQGSQPERPDVLGDSITEDWEGCATGGYWTKATSGHAWKWDFTDAGIWKDYLRHGDASCRLGKTSSSAIAMAQDFEGGVGAIGFWAGAYGSDQDAMLRVDYSTNQGSSWTALATVTVQAGALTQYLMATDIKEAARFRIVQAVGARVNIDDITLYGRVSQDVTGDVNGDGEVNIADANTLIDIILGKPAADDVARRADLNNDGEINIADVNALIDIILAD